MAYDEGLAERIQFHLKDHPGLSTRNMFGGLCYMVNGHMCCGITGEDLMLRLGKEGGEKALEKPHTRPMDFTGKPMKSMIYVDAQGVEEDHDLARWIQTALDFVETLPPKK